MSMVAFHVAIKTVLTFAAELPAIYIDVDRGLYIALAIWYKISTAP